MWTIYIKLTCSDTYFIPFKVTFTFSFRLFSTWKKKNYPPHIAWWCEYILLPLHAEPISLIVNDSSGSRVYIPILYRDGTAGKKPHLLNIHNKIAFSIRHTLVYVQQGEWFILSMYHHHRQRKSVTVLINSIAQPPFEQSFACVYSLRCGKK